MKIALIGAGNFGTAIAYAMARNNHEVIIYDIIESRVEDINNNHRNSEVFPGLELPENISARSGFDAYLNECTLVAIVVSSSALPLVLNQIKSFLTTETVVLNLSKGFVKETGQTLDEIYYENLGQDIYFGVGSGPNFAAEIVKGDPSTMVLATKSDKVFEVVNRALSSDLFSLDQTSDILGLEICAGIKNVMAIATGMHSGLGLGANSRFTLLSRAVEEIAGLVLAAGGELQTVLSPAGVGDLIMTGTSENSRNFRFGYLVGQGFDRTEALAKIESTVEGLDALEPALIMGRKFELALPITNALSHVVFGKSSPKEKILQLI